MAAPKGFLVVPVGDNPDGDLRSLTVDANDYLQVALSDLGGSAGMGEPKGLLLTPIAYNPDGDLRSLELDASDYLLVTVLGGSDDDILASDGTKGVWESIASLLKSALLTANGDLLIRNGSGVVTRLPAGAVYTILGLSSGIPAWVAGARKTLTAKGDILTTSAANALARLGIGSTGEVLTVAAGLPAWAAATGGYAEGCRIGHDADQTITNNTTTTLAFNTEDFDTDGMHDVSSNNERITCVTAGKYFIYANIRWQSGQTGYRRLNINHQAGGAIAVGRVHPVQVGGTDQFALTVWDMAVDDYVTCVVRHTQGADRDVLSGGDYSPTFGAQRIG